MRQRRNARREIDGVRCTRPPEARRSLASSSPTSMCVSKPSRQSRSILLSVASGVSPGDRTGAVQGGAPQDDAPDAPSQARARRSGDIRILRVVVEGDRVTAVPNDDPQQLIWRRRRVRAVQRHPDLVVGVAHDPPQGLVGARRRVRPMERHRDSVIAVADGRPQRLVGRRRGIRAVQSHRHGVAASTAAARIRRFHGRPGWDPAPVASVAELHARAPSRVVVYRIVRVVGA
jgi:hypothetical protein